MGRPVEDTPDYHRPGLQSWRVMLRAALPIELEVYDEPEARTNYAATCRCSLVFRLTDDAARNLRRRGLLDQRAIARGNPCVCLCMGRLVD